MLRSVGPTLLLSCKTCKNDGPSQYAWAKGH
jgi:hypothetical protein